MTGQESSLRAQQLVGRAVYDATGKSLGRVYDLVAKRRGDELCVTDLLIGPGSWLTRFGWTKELHGRTVRWQDIEQLSPDIRLRREG